MKALAYEYIICDKPPRDAFQNNSHSNTQKMNRAPALPKDGGRMWQPGAGFFALAANFALQGFINRYRQMAGLKDREYN